MKYFGLLLIVSLAAGLHLALSQVSDCTDINNALGIPMASSDPVTVPDLPVCVNQRGIAQCCSTQFILDSISTTEQSFLEGLRIELRETFQGFEDLFQRLREYAQGSFLTSYVKRLSNFGFLNGQNGRGPGNGRGNQIVNNLIAMLRNRIDFNPDDDDDIEMPTQGSQNVNNGRGGFSVRGLLGNLVSTIANAAAEEFAGPGNGAGRQCIRRIIENQIQVLSMDIQARGLQQIRRVVASFDLLRDFVRNFTQDLQGFRPLQQCITALVQLNTCGRCEAVLPPFCENVCGAISRACYSPINDVLEEMEQLEQLVEVVEGILAAATDAITDLNESQGILNITAAISQISTECQIDIPIPGIRARRQSDDDDDDDDDRDIPAIPGLIRAAVAVLRGRLSQSLFDDNEGPIGICRLINTSSSNCWDGTQNRTEDIDEFLGEDISDQVNNPIISIPQDQLIDQVTSIGTPITNVLNSQAFAQVAPQGLVLPDTGPVPGPNNGATTTILTLTSLALMLMASCLFI